MRILCSRFSLAEGDGAKANGLSNEVPAIPKVTTPPQLEINTRPEQRVRNILQMIECETILSVRDLALAVHLSPSYLQHLFKHQTGVSIGGWLKEQKLQRAAQLLENSYMSVKEIAHTVGYEHASSFVRAFRGRFAQAPARYRDRMNCRKC
jgi:AraC-like DNA-binding protein